MVVEFFEVVVDGCRSFLLLVTTSSHNISPLQYIGLTIDR